MVYAIQHKQLDSGIAFLHGMWSMLPEKDRKWSWTGMGVSPWQLVDYIGLTKADAEEMTRKVEQEIKDKVVFTILPSVPIAFNLSADATGQIMNKKILWINKTIIIIENAISKWVHSNMDRANY